ncbi:MAG: class I SAM-dependent methyltransferase [Chloroflexi bacterium]|nr:class I SAM-dependent methyltransferase [Chloroflexota bacterium]
MARNNSPLHGFIVSGSGLEQSKTIHSQTSMAETDEFWDFFWETRLLPMETLGKREAILAASRMIRSLAQKTARPLRILELGCGEGQIMGTLLDAHAQLCDVHASVGIDVDRQALSHCRRAYPGVRWVEGDFTDRELLLGLGKFDILLLVNALHEVFSEGYSPELGEVDVPEAKQRVEQALAAAAGCLAPGGCLILFDGLEPPGDPFQRLRIHFLSDQARDEFELFARQYRPFRIVARQIEYPQSVELSRRDFTRYITKSIFISKPLWETERFESYQYYSEVEFREVFARRGLEILELATLTVNGEKWRSRVEVEPSDAEFPQEHILILARAASGAVT